MDEEMNTQSCHGERSDAALLRALRRTQPSSCIINPSKRTS